MGAATGWWRVIRVVSPVTAGGRIDTPPTIADGLCLFGSHDGWVYCLRAADGRLAWRFRAAPFGGLAF